MIFENLKESYINGNISQVRSVLLLDNDLKELFLCKMIDYIYKNSDYVNEDIQILIRRFV